MSDPVKHLEANGCKHALIEAGEPNATAVLLLHGFPNNKNLWQKQVGSALMVTILACYGSHTDTASAQVPVLVKAGFRVIVPDLRGAVGGESYSPAEVEAYHIDKHIVKDLAGVAQIPWTVIPFLACCACKFIYIHVYIYMSAAHGCCFVLRQPSHSSDRLCMRKATRERCREPIKI